MSRSARDPDYLQQRETPLPFTVHCAQCGCENGAHSYWCIYRKTLASDRQQGGLMDNKRGRAWYFPDNWQQKEELYKLRIKQLEERVEQLEAELANSGHAIPEEILEAEIIDE